MLGKSEGHFGDMAKFLILLILTACESSNQVDPAVKLRQTEWAEPCHDEAMLLATTTGSPDRFECSNRFHRMHVQVATHPSKEEAAALVFCECDRDAGAK